MDSDLSEALEAARARAGEIDRTGDWPAADLAALASAGATRWAVPAEFGGDGLPLLELYQRYERLAASSLTLALILSQRDSGVAMIASAEGLPSRPGLLESLRDNATFTTVGIAQLTTSRQGGTPALRAARVSDGWRIDGLIPWSTGAAHADFVVAGAATEDGNQILFLLPTRTGPAHGPSPGVAVDPPLPLVALRATWTGRVRCEGVFISDDRVLRGPEPKVLGRRGPTLPLGQAFLALGLCRGALDLIAAHRSASAASALLRMEGQWSRLRQWIVSLSAPGRETEAAAHAARARGAVNDLAVRVTHAAVALYKGTALLDTHPAQRLAREAMFLLVWSCPDPVIDYTVDVLSGGC